MCWESNKLKIKTAKKDIPVWKIVFVDSSNKCHSLYAKFTYVKSVIETSSINFELRRCGKTIIGTIGFHSYSNKLKWKMSDNTIFVLKKKIPFRVQDFIEVYNGYPDTRVAKFHIPAGAKYAKNKDGEIISSAIVFDNFIN